MGREDGRLPAGVGDLSDRAEHADVGPLVADGACDDAVHDGGSAGLDHEVSGDPPVEFEADPRPHGDAAGDIPAQDGIALEGDWPVDLPHHFLHFRFLVPWFWSSRANARKQDLSGTQIDLTSGP